MKLSFYFTVFLFIGFLSFKNYFFISNHSTSNYTKVRSNIDNIILPIEVLGEEGITKTVSFSITNEINIQTEKVWLLINNLSYENKGSIKINDQSWVSLNHSTAEVNGKELAYGGMVHGGFNTIRLTIPSTGIKEGVNTIQFRFDTSDGISIGYRVVKINLLDSSNNKLLSETMFEEDNPNTWTAPQNSSISNGENLWFNKNLWNHYRLNNDTGFWYGKTTPSRRPIKAKCADCHTKDGRDLEIFSYSNLSIIERSKFHGLTEQEGKDISAYIRSLSSKSNVGRHGRPWNPPYQPGPELANKSINEWSAGAGLDWVLEKDADMVSYVFPNGTSKEEVRAIFDSDKMQDRTLIPIAIQLPDWKHWLPIIHPKDAYAKNNWWDNSLPNEQNPIFTYEAVRSKFENNYDPASIKAFNVPQRLRELGRGLDGQNGFRHFYQHGSTQTKHWRSENGNAENNLTSGIDSELAKTSMARLQAVKYFELVSEFDLQDKAAKTVPDVEADKPLDRQWPAKWYSVFEVPAHFTARKKNGVHRNFDTQPIVTGVFETTVWYHLQFIVNGGNGFVGGTTPQDFNYHHPFIGFTAYHSGISEPLRYVSGINHMYQVRTWSGNNGPGNEGFRIRNQGIWEMLGISNSNQQFWNPPHDIIKQLDDIAPGLSNSVLEAMLLQFLNEVEKYDVNTWPRSTHGGDYQLDLATKTTADLITIPYDTNPENGRVNEHWADKFYDLIPRIKSNFNVDCNITNRIINWCKSAWPLIDFEKFLIDNCNENPQDCNSVEVVPNNIYKIETINNKYLSTREGSNNITQRQGDDTDYQKWKLEPASNGYYFIKNIATGKYIHSPNDITNGLSIQQRDFDGSNRQQWEIIVVGNCTFSITSKHTGTCLDLIDGSIEEGTRIQQWECSSNSSQYFTLELVSQETLNIGEISFSDVFMYPNPVKDVLYVNISNSIFNSNVGLKVYDVSGRVVIVKESVKNKIELNVSSLTTGVYFIHLIDDGKLFKKVFVKE